ncbi:MAG: ATP synthase F1 subunit delta [Solirubrobacterales bacterium]
MEEIAQVYARSLFDVASEQGNVEVVREQLGQLADALDENQDLRLFCFSPYFSSEEKKRGLQAAISDVDPAVERFLMLLVENERLPLIGRIRREYDRLCDQAEDLLAVTVTSAVALDPGVISRLVEQISEQTGSRVELTEEVDPSIVGGVVLRVGNSILDASIRNRLENLRTEVARA